MVKIRRQLIADTSMKFAGRNPKTYLTIHETANRSKGANAAAHANLQSRQWPGASWHWSVDDKEAVQSYPHDFRLWHAGDGQGHGNMSSIAIETCVHESNNWAQTKRNLIDLAVTIMQAEGIPLSRVVQHNHWSGKNCPTILRSNGNREWAEIIAGIKAKLEGGKTPAPKPVAPSKQQEITLLTGWWNYATAADAQAMRNAKRVMPAGKYRVTKTAGGVPHLVHTNGKHSGWVHPSVLTGTPAASQKSISQMASEVIAGRHGDGHAKRKASLGVSEAVYQQVRAEVNRRV